MEETKGITKKIQSKVVEFSLLEEENKRLEQQLQMLVQQEASFDILRVHLKDIKTSKQESEFLASLGPGILVKARLTDNDKVLVNVGSGVVVEKSCDEAEKIIKKQISKLENARKEIEIAIRKNFDRMTKLEKEIRKDMERKG